MTPELNEEVRHLMAREEIPEAAFWVPMRLVFMGRIFRHGNQSHALKLRFFDRRRAEYADKKVHEHIIAHGPVGELREHALHYSYRDISHWVDKMNRYTTLGGREGPGAARRPPLGDPAGGDGPFHFVQDWIFQRNILEGLPGFCWSALADVARLMKYANRSATTGMSTPVPGPGPSGHWIAGGGRSSWTGVPAPLPGTCLVTWRGTSGRPWPPATTRSGPRRLLRQRGLRAEHGPAAAPPRSDPDGHGQPLRRRRLALNPGRVPGRRRARMVCSGKSCGHRVGFIDPIYPLIHEIFATPTRTSS